ncbi:hypothetical protein SBA2_170035 [Acidobacteriia bacterium SbA2]|nr:hypothetical protein SBA2_170035 [Acidobacteriia bacterium SbA2]
MNYWAIGSLGHWSVGSIAVALVILRPVLRAEESRQLSFGFSWPITNCGDSSLRSE